MQTVANDDSLTPLRPGLSIHRGLLLCAAVCLPLLVIAAYLWPRYDAATALLSLPAYAIALVIAAILLVVVVLRRLLRTARPSASDVPLP